MSILRLSVAAAMVILGPALAAAAEQPADGAAERALVDRYCVTCHNASLRVAGLRSTRPTSRGSETMPRSGRRSSASSARG